MAEMNRRTMLKVACAIPIVGGFSKLLATEMPLEFWNPRIHPNSQSLLRLFKSIKTDLHELKSLNAAMRNLKDHIKELRKIPRSRG